MTEPQKQARGVAAPWWVTIRHGERVELPSRLQPDTIIAYKRAAIVADPLRLFGVGMNAAYGPDDAATCRAAKCPTVCEVCDDHGPVPNPRCSCGFYAVPKERLAALAAAYPAVADVEVELFGRVVVHRDGWRASRQRVLGVYLNPACRHCGRAATVLAAREPDRVWMFTRDLRLESHLPVIASCWVCASGSTWSPAELSSVWGVECRWGSVT